ncbi:GtrA family protein [Sinosporangium siamense]|uniref:Membrane protein n=1 Tax=Sinosporangium siamense TaxID=1367973 RepID=A0A919V5K7_9ACTN|nr:GtrA family protein [Sinosporangium siamense]GII90976.1 membrane protein [Sinosporangium siamense]
MQLLRRIYGRITGLFAELAKFGTIGAIAFVIDFSLTNYLRYGLGEGPLTSKVVATTVAATISYAGNRFWTFRHREQSGYAREYVLFFILNAIGLLISVLVIGFVSYTLKLNDPVSFNIAQLVGVGLGTLFRYWSYSKWVFLAIPKPPAVDEAGDLPSPRSPQGEPSEATGPASPASEGAATRL